MACIAVGDTIPDGTLSYADEADQILNVSVHSLAAGKKSFSSEFPVLLLPHAGKTFISSS